MKRTLAQCCAALLFAQTVAFAASVEGDPAERISLDKNWQIQSSASVPATGAELSQSDYEAKNWYDAHVPTTVVAALVDDKLYPNPDFGKNLRDITGTTYPIGDNFSNIQMPPESPFKSPWWYRTTFQLPSNLRSKRLQLHFDGINFRANVWLNGKQIASASELAGSWRLFELDVTDQVAWDRPNALAVEVYPPTPDDLAITFVDWNPSPPDKGMGIWRPVYVTASGPVVIRFPQVVTKLALPAAHLIVSAEVKNVTAQPVSGVLQGDIAGQSFSQSITIPGNQNTVATFAPLTVDHPKLWWPYGLGAQTLYKLNLRFKVDGKVSDEVSTRVGIREVTSELVPQPEGAKPSVARLFKINGKNILIRGGGYSFDMLLRQSPERDAEDLQYVRDMHLNTVRLEGKIVSDDFLDLADQYGILITAGWCCCDHWEHWKDWDEEDYRIAADSLRDQIRRLRNHPSIFNWMDGSDNPPPPKVETMYVGILKQLNWPNPFESSATARPTPVTGETGVKMSGPYDYVPPNYWLADKKELGGAHAFNTETSPGAAVPPVDSLRDMLPQDHLWPVDSWWDYHAGGGVFRTIGNYTRALDERYGRSNSVEEFSEKSQAAAYEGERAMFEAYGRNKYVSTGVIQWMLNNAWPSIIWHLYDYTLRPGGGYFGTKKACEQLHVQYSYDDHSVVVVNSLYQPFQNLTVAAKIYDLNLRERFSNTERTQVAADGVSKVFILPVPDNLTTTYFVRLTLNDSTGKQVSSNFYWLSTKPDTLNWQKSTWYFTPETSYADLTELNSLPRVHLNVASTAVQTLGSGRGRVTVTVQNPTDKLAFLVHLKLVKYVHDPEVDDRHQQEDVRPILWQDNYFPLFPGEKREIEAEYTHDTDGAPAIVEVDGWNIDPVSKPLGAQ